MTETKRQDEHSGSPACSTAIDALGITYGGRGPGGEFYSKDLDSLRSISLWTECAEGESWTPEELEAIAAHKRSLRQQ